MPINNALRSGSFVSSQRIVANKLGPVVGRHPNMPTAGVAAPGPISVEILSDAYNDPSRALPAVWRETEGSVWHSIQFYSADHGSGAGGIYLKALRGDPSVSTEYVWWDDIPIDDPVKAAIIAADSSTPLTNPIYVTDELIPPQVSFGDQTEAPNVIQGAEGLYLFPHNRNNYTSPDGKLAQNTMVAVSEDGVNFETRAIALSYDPRFLAGDGHTGYLNPIESMVEYLRFKYSGFALHGGANATLPRNGGGANYYSNNLYDWYIPEITNRAGTSLMEGFLPDDGFVYVYTFNGYGSRLADAGELGLVFGRASRFGVSGGTSSNSTVLCALVDRYGNLKSVPVIVSQPDQVYDDLQTAIGTALPWNGTDYYLARVRGAATGNQIACTTISTVANDYELLNPTYNNPRLHAAYEGRGDVVPVDNLTTINANVANNPFRTELIVEDNNRGYLFLNQSVIPGNFAAVKFEFLGFDVNTTVPVERFIEIATSMTDGGYAQNIQFRPSDTASNSAMRIEGRIGGTPVGGRDTSDYWGRGTSYLNDDEESPEAVQGQQFILFNLPTPILMVLKGTGEKEYIELPGWNMALPLFMGMGMDNQATGGQRRMRCYGMKITTYDSLPDDGLSELARNSTLIGSIRTNRQFISETDERAKALIKGSSMGAIRTAVFSTIAANGADLRASLDAAGFFEVPLEIVRDTWDAVAEDADIYAAIPFFSDRGTDIYFWRSNFLYHLDRQGLKSTFAANFDTKNTFRLRGNRIASVGTSPVQNGAPSYDSVLGALCDGTNDFFSDFDSWDPRLYSLKLVVRFNVLKPTGLLYQASGIDGGFGAAGARLTQGIIVNADLNFNAVMQQGADRINGTSRIQGTTVVQAGVDYHVVVTCNQEGFLRLYVNGLEEANFDLGNSGLVFDQSLLPLLRTAATPTSTANGRQLDGYIRDVEIYNRVELSAAQVLDKYDNETQNLTFFTPDTTPPVITLLGDNPVNIGQNEVYNSAGATALDNIDGDLTANIVVGGTFVDTSTLGTFTETYNVQDADGNSAVQVVRTINVVDITAPVITLLGDNPFNVDLDGTFVDPGATAVDDTDGDLTGSIVQAGAVDTSTAGTYVRTYNVADAAGNNALEVTRTVNVNDVTAPVITLLGSNPFNVAQGAPFNDPGATATDNVDGDITGSITTGGTFVDTSSPGTFTRTYDVDDAAGNSAVQVVRTINVNAGADTTPPVITLLGGSSIQVALDSTYNDDGATATDNIDGNLTSSIVVVNNVDTSAIGNYTVTYNVSDAAGNAATEVVRNVAVVDQTIPTINLTGDNPLTLPFNQAYVEPGFSATDNVDGDITANVVFGGTFVDASSVGTFTRTYDVDDAAGNSAVQAVRTINVVDVTPPVITLQGNSFVQISTDDTYSDEGATALDDVDGNLTGSIAVVSNVDDSQVGTYTVTYNVSDAAGNAAVEVVRNVQVVLGQQGPIANAGPDQVVFAGDLVTLAGSGSDANNDPLTALWTPPAGITLSDATDLAATFTAPAVISSTPYVLSLVVNDGTVDSPADTVTITVNPAASEAFNRLNLNAELTTAGSSCCVDDFYGVLYENRDNKIIITIDDGTTDPITFTDIQFGLFDLTGEQVSRVTKTLASGITKTNGVITISLNPSDINFYGTYRMEVLVVQGTSAQLIQGEIEIENTSL